MPAVRVFKTKWFRRFARRERIDDIALCEAIARANRGLIDADLGANVIKQRVARPGQGRSGGYRSLIVFRVGDRAVFVFGFAKSSQGDLAPDELDDVRTAAKLFLGYDAEQLGVAVANGELWEVMCDAEAL
jgi:hypothetical protein